MTLHQLTADYLHYRRALGYRLVRDGQILGSFCHRLGHLPLRAISPNRVLSFLCPGHLCHEIVARKHRALSGLYQYAHGRHGALLPTLPHLPGGRSSSFIPYVYSHADLRRLLRATAVTCLCKGAQQGTTRIKLRCSLERRKGRTHGYREAV
jgi:hypothetical protein